MVLHVLYTYIANHATAFKTAEGFIRLVCSRCSFHQASMTLLLLLLKNTVETFQIILRSKHITEKYCRNWITRLKQLPRVWYLILRRNEWKSMAAWNKDHTLTHKCIGCRKKDQQIHKVLNTWSKTSKHTGIVLWYRAGFFCKCHYDPLYSIFCALGLLVWKEQTRSRPLCHHLWLAWLSLSSSETCNYATAAACIQTVECQCSDSAVSVASGWGGRAEVLIAPRKAVRALTMHWEEHRWRTQSHKWGHPQAAQHGRRAELTRAWSVFISSTLASSQRSQFLITDYGLLWPS